MKLVNQLIYEYANQLAIFNDCDIKIPVRINFFLQKNIQAIFSAAQEIDQMRMSLGKQYGVLNEAKTGYDIPSEHAEKVNKELNDLFNLEQDINIHIFQLNDFDGIDLTYQQMAAIMFMIEE